MTESRSEVARQMGKGRDESPLGGYSGRVKG